MNLPSTFVVVAMLVGACARQPIDEATLVDAPVRYPALAAVVGPTLWFEPMDLTTSAAETVPKVGIDPGGTLLESSLLQATSELLSLRTWPELEPVDAEVTTIQASPSGGGDPRSYVEVRARSALADRWYALRLASVPAGLSIAPHARATLPDGTTGARFRPGSQPVVTAVRVCGRGDRRTVSVDFSETVQPNSAHGLRVVAPGTSCGPSVLAGEAASSVTLQCGRLDLPFDVEVASSLRSLSGGAVTDLVGRVGPFTYRMTPARLATWGYDCSTLRPGDI